MILCPLLASAAGDDDDGKITGQTVYVPAYSHIHHGNKDAPPLLSVTLGIRNVDQDTPPSSSPWSTTMRPREHC